MKRLWMILALVGMLCAGAGAYGQTAGTGSEVVAEIAGQKITRDQLVKELLARHGDQVLASLMEATAIEAHARAENITVTDEQVNRAYEATRAQIERQAAMSGMDFESWLMSQGLCLSAFKRQIRVQELLRAAVEPSVTVTDEEVARFYEVNKDSMAQTEAVWAAHIAVSTKEEAESIRQRILSGQLSWDDAAREHSIDPYGKENGGVIGWIVRGEDPVRVAVFALARDDEITPAIANEMGSFSIFKRVRYRPGGVPPFETVEDDIREAIRSRKLFDAMQARRLSILNLANPRQLVHFSEPVPEAGAAE